MGCRIHGELKEALEREATDAGTTLSAYIEAVLLRRKDVDVDVNALKNRVFRLEAENVNLLRQIKSEHGESPELAACDVEIRSLKQQKYDLLDSLNKVVAQRDALAKFQGEAIPHWLSRNGYQRTVEYLEKLRAKFPKRDFEQLLISALAVALGNSAGGWMRTLPDFWDRYPDFFTNKTSSK